MQIDVCPLAEHVSVVLRVARSFELLRAPPADRVRRQERVGLRDRRHGNIVNPATAGFIGRSPHSSRRKPRNRSFGVSRIA